MNRFRKNNHRGGNPFLMGPLGYSKHKRKWLMKCGMRVWIWIPILKKRAKKLGNVQRLLQNLKALGKN